MGKKLVILFVFVASCFLQATENFEEKVKRSAFAYNLFHEACFASRVNSTPLLFWATTSHQKYKETGDITKKIQSLDELNKYLAPCINLDYTIKNIGIMRFSLLHEIGHVIDVGSPKQHLLQNRRDKKESKKAGIIAGTLSCAATILALDYAQNPKTKESFPNRCIRIAAGFGVGFLTDYLVANYWLACSNWKKERAADNHALKHLSCSKCCFETAQLFKIYHQDDLNSHPALEQAIRTFLLGDGHEAHLPRAKRFHEQGLKDQEQNKLCKWHKYPWLQKTAERKIELDAKTVEKLHQLHQLQQNCIKCNSNLRT